MQRLSFKIAQYDGETVSIPVLAEMEDSEGEYALYADAQAALEEKEAEWRGWGIVEIAVRNPNVRSYIYHWEGRALAAEQRIAALEAENARLKAPVSVEEWDANYGHGGEDGRFKLCDIIDVNRLIAARAEGGSDGKQS